MAGLPNGTVVLPAFDTLMDDDAATAALDDQTHPQFGMLRLLKRMEISRHEIRDWPLKDHAEIQIKRIGLRRRLMSPVMRPAVTTDTWRELPKISENALAGFERFDCAGEAEEAKVIALALREVTPENTNSRAGVAPDRNLARRVAAELRRWDIEIDDSAGLPLAETPPGLFLQLVAEMVAKNFAPVSTLAALKHPFASCGSDRNVFRRQVRQWEFEGPARPEAGTGFAWIDTFPPADMKPERHADAVSLLKLLKMRPAASPRQCPAPEIFLSGKRMAAHAIGSGSVIRRSRRRRRIETLGGRSR